MREQSFREVTPTNAKRVEGSLAENQELVRRAMSRARRMAGLEPVKRYVDGEHWVFMLPRRAAVPCGDRRDPTSESENGGEA